MRKAILKTTEWVHATLILALILPAVYCLGAGQPDLIGGGLYMKCLVIAFPVAATDFAVRNCKGLSSYLTVCALILAGTAVLAGSAAAPLRGSSLFWIYMLVITCETLFIIINRISERMHDGEPEAPVPDGGAPDDRNTGAEAVRRLYYESLTTPSFAVLLYFAAVYAFALNLNNPAACNAALFSAVIYTVNAILHRYISETEAYLALNRRTCNIPSKRIYGIGFCMLAIFLLLFIIVTLPSVFTTGRRHYRDIRKSAAFIEFDYEEFMKETPNDPVMNDPAQLLAEQYGEPGEPPVWLTTLFSIMATIAFAVFAAMLIKIVYDTFRAFREAADDNGDIVEELESGDEVFKIRKIKIAPRKLSERERIRKEYRRFIRRYRKERPALHESPTEIEKQAGIYDNAECRELHNIYEKARYRQEI